jgi:hypothetical protein
MQQGHAAAEVSTTLIKFADQHASFWMDLGAQYGACCGACCSTCAWHAATTLCVTYVNIAEMASCSSQDMTMLLRRGWCLTAMAQNRQLTGSSVLQWEQQVGARQQQHCCRLQQCWVGCLLQTGCWCLLPGLAVLQPGAGTRDYTVCGYSV